MVGSIVSHYRILERLGGGGMGVVYKAEDTRLKRLVAIKFLPFDLTRDPEAKARFIQEARAASSLQHPNISTIHDLDETPEGQLFIVQEYHGHTSLKDLLSSRHRLSLTEAFDIALQVAGGLAEVHRKGIIHRDIKPSNLMIAEDGRVKIVDFGLAKLLSRSTLTREGATPGTPAYMSPEQVRGIPSTPLTDMWSLGVVLYEMLTGERPFQSEFDEGVIYAILHEEPRPLQEHRSDVPPDCERLVARALHKDPARRYPSMESLAEDLALLRRGHRLGGVRSVLRSLMRPVFRRRLLLSGAAAITLAAGVLLVGPSLRSWLIADQHRSLAIASCEDQTGDSLQTDLLYAISDALARYLSSFPQLEVLSVNRLSDLAAQAGRLDQRGDLEVPIINGKLAREVCNTAGVDILLAPMLFTFPSGDYGLTVEMKDPHTNALLRTAVSHAGLRRDLMAQVRQVIDSITVALSLPRDQRSRIIAKVASLTTDSIESYRHYALARLGQSSFRSREFQRHMLSSIAEDSTFGSAYMLLAEREAGFFNYKKAQEVLQHAEKLGLLEESSEEQHRRRMLSLAWEDHYGRASLSTRVSLQRRYVSLHPEDKVAHFQLAKVLRFEGRIDQARQELEEALSLDPSYVDALNDLAWIHAYYRGDLATGLDYFGRIEALRPESFASLGGRACVRFMMGDFEHVFFLQQRMQTFVPSWNGPVLISYVCALEEDYKAAEDQAEFQARIADTHFFRAQGRLMEAHLDLWRGRLREGRRKIRDVLELADSTANQGLRAEALWLQLWSTLQDSTPSDPRPLPELWDPSSGLIQVCNPWYAFYRGRSDLRQHRLEKLESYARELEADVGTFFPRDRPLAGDLARVLRLERLLALDSAAAVVSSNYVMPEFTTLVPHINCFIEPGADGPRTSWLFSFSQDIMARAFIAIGDTDRAILEYERLIRHAPSRRLWIPPSLHFRLARVYERSGALEQAADQYEAFLAIWNQPDVGLEDFREAREHLLNLRPQTRLAHR